MIQKKICMLGAPGVGKTSLVARFVKSIFFEKYHSTVGVKIDRKNVTVDGNEYALVLWDLAGEDEFATVQASYLRGTAGCLLVVDGTRPATLDMAVLLRERAIGVAGDVPAIVLLNKSDLSNQWSIDEAAVSALVERGFMVLRTSAKTGDQVEAAFTELTRKMA